MNCLQERKNDSVIIMVSHDPDVLAQCDTVLDICSIQNSNPDWFDAFSKTLPCFRLCFVCFVHLMYSLSWSVDTHSYLCYHSQQIHRDFCKETILCGFISCEDLPPRNTPDHFAVCFTRQNPSPVLRGRYFSFPGKIAPWKFHEPTERDTGSPVNAAAKQGQELRSGQTAIHIYEQRNSLLIFAS